MAVPRWIVNLRLRTRAIVRRPQVERDLDDELSFHLAMQAKVTQESRGVSETEALRQARREFGGVQQTREHGRDLWPLRWAGDLAADLQYGVRGLRRTPGFTCAAVIVLALGIGATTAIFSVVSGVLLKPLSFHEPDRLVALYHVAPGFGATVTHLPQSPATYFTYRDNARVFEDVGVWSAANVSIVRHGEPEQAPALMVSDGLLSLLGVRPLLGGLLRKEDDVPGAANRVLLTYGYWQRALGASRDVVGQSLVMHGSSCEIAGVLPASFQLLDTDLQVGLPL